VISEKRKLFSPRSIDSHTLLCGSHYPVVFRLLFFELVVSVFNSKRSVVSYLALYRWV